MLAQNAVESEEHTPAKETKGGIQDVLIRMAVGLVINLIARKVKQRQSRKKAAHKAEKLARKGKKIPADLQTDMVKGLSRRARRKLASEAEQNVTPVENKKAKKREKAKKKSKIRKLARLVALAVLVVLVVRLARSQQVAARTGATLWQQLFEIVQ